MMLFPRRCPACGLLGDAPCADCARCLRRADDVVSIPGLVTCRSVFVYDEVARRLLLALKYRNRRDALAFLASEVAALVDVDVDARLVTWVPTTAARRRRRGFDQAELLARAVGRRLAVPARPLLRRIDGRPQTGLGSAARVEGPRFEAWSARRSPDRSARSVLLVDDIGTTGATLRAAAAVLSASGIAEVHARTVAWTPRRGVP
jgi:ComF family protein